MQARGRVAGVKVVVDFSNRIESEIRAIDHRLIAVAILLLDIRSRDWLRVGLGSGAIRFAIDQL